MNGTKFEAITLEDLGVIRARGADVIAFLQGQLSADVTKLAPARSALAGYHNPQGRTIALLRLASRGPDDVLAILPRELVPAVLTRLSRFILRAKVRLTDETAGWRVEGLRASAGDDAPAFAGLALPGALDDQSDVQGASVIRIDARSARWLVISPASGPAPLAACARAERESWRGDDIAAGLPQVYAATSEAFVAQMLNLDALGAVAFDKGCYTGQEVIARAHYRGRVKRRMQRLRSHAQIRLAAGDTGRLGDGRSFRVVEAVQLADGRSEFLAVAPLAGDAGGSDAEAEAAPERGSALEADVLPLPYALPG